MADPMASLKQSRYFPEILPFSEVPAIPAASEMLRPIALLSRIQQTVGLGMWLRLRDIRTLQTAGVDIRVRADGFSHTMPTTAMPALGAEIPAKNDFLGTNFMELTLINTTLAPIAAQEIIYTLAAYPASAAEKLAAGRTLEDQEGADLDAILAEVLTAYEIEVVHKRGIIQAVRKGTLPTNLDFRLGRFYPVIARDVFAVRVPALAAGNRATVAHIIPRSNEVCILTGVSSASSVAAADNTRLLISRDNVQDYLDMQAFPLRIATDINCWVPALRELRVELISGVPLVNYDTRITVTRVALNDFIRMNYGIMSPSENPDLAEVITGGIA